MSIIDTLITNRTAAGFYDIEDLNRVGAALHYLAARLNSAGTAVTVDARTNWAVTDGVTPMEAERYLENVRKIRAALAVSASTAAVPRGATPFDAQEANDIEKILLDVDGLISKMGAAYFYAGEVFAGEV